MIQSYRAILKMTFAVLIIPASLKTAHCSTTLAPVGQITGVYRRGKSLIVTLETTLKLPTGLVVYIGEERKIPAILKDHYKTSETSLVYEATVAKQVDIAEGEKVFVEGEIQGKGADVYIKLDRRAVFLPKSEGQVLASHGPQVHIDRGSLHEVRERDIYAIYDSSGKYKGKTEMRGIGDNQSIGRLYTSAKKEIEPGDTVKFLGQRKYFGLGVHVARDIFTVPKEDPPIEDVEPISGGGLAWWWTFPNGWGVKWIWGYSSIDVSRSFVYTDTETSAKSTKYERYHVTYSYPLTVRKNFFYPGIVSPYLGITLGHYLSHFNYNEIKGMVVSPTVGVELFTTRLIHIFLDATYLQLPEFEARGEKRQYKKVLFSFGVTTNW